MFQGQEIFRSPTLSFDKFDADLDFLVEEMGLDDTAMQATVANELDELYDVPDDDSIQTRSINSDETSMQVTPACSPTISRSNSYSSHMNRMQAQCSDAALDHSNCTLKRPLSEGQVAHHQIIPPPPPAPVQNPSMPHLADQQTTIDNSSSTAKMDSQTAAQNTPQNFVRSWAQQATKILSNTNLAINQVDMDLSNRMIVPVDTSGDGICDALAVDTTRSGQLDHIFVAIDTTGDGYCDRWATLMGDTMVVSKIKSEDSRQADHGRIFLPLDSTGDGNPDKWALLLDTNGDGLADAMAVDVSGTGHHQTMVPVDTTFGFGRANQWGYWLDTGRVQVSNGDNHMVLMKRQLQLKMQQEAQWGMGCTGDADTDPESQMKQHCDWQGLMAMCIKRHFVAHMVPKRMSIDRGSDRSQPNKHMVAHPSTSHSSSYSQGIASNHDSSSAFASLQEDLASVPLTAGHTHPQGGAQTVTRRPSKKRPEPQRWARTIGTQVEIAITGCQRSLSNLLSRNGPSAPDCLPRQPAPDCLPRPNPECLPNTKPDCLHAD